MSNNLHPVFEAALAPFVNHQPKCMDCGKPCENFGLDMVLPDDQWKAINPHVSGLLCAQCIVNRAEQLIPCVIRIDAQIITV